jgi:hypothetical protein
MLHGLVFPLRMGSKAKDLTNQGHKGKANRVYITRDRGATGRQLRIGSSPLLALCDARDCDRLKGDILAVTAPVITFFNADWN